MSTRVELDRELDHLAAMLPPWLERLRHRNQFWPQFDVLAEEIIARSSPRDRFHVERRLLQMLRRHRLHRKAVTHQRRGQRH